MKRRRKDSGFAMLLVFLMSACVAITLYMEIPRVAFEAERQRELLLVDRGNQFKRAIQVFITDKTNNPMQRWPGKIEELESFNNHRYLRHRYIDPMTGKDEWRLIHINGGVLTDSVTQKPPAQNGQSASGASSGGSTYLSTQAYMDVPTGDNGSGGNTGGVNRALNRRPSDTAGAPGELNNPGATGDAGAPPTVGLPGMPGAPGANQPGMPVIPGFPGQPGASGVPSTAPPGMPPDQSGLQASGGMPGMPGATGTIGGGGPGVPGSGQSSAQSAATGMIANLLTTPRPGGMPSNMPGSTMGGGIAGVASKFEAEGIMVINQRTKINEWEFIFDITKYRPPPNPVAGAVGTPQQQQQQGPGNTGTTPTTPGPGGVTPQTPTGH